jgi:hypothetical protein
VFRRTQAKTCHYTIVSTINCGPGGKYRARRSATTEEGQARRLMPFQIPKGFGFHGGPPLATRRLTAS